VLFFKPYTHSKTWTGAVGLSHGAWIPVPCLPVPSFPYLACVSQLGQTNCCPLFETKDSRERIDIALASKKQCDSKTAA